MARTLLLRLLFTLALMGGGAATAVHAGQDAAAADTERVRPTGETAGALLPAHSPALVPLPVEIDGRGGFRVTQTAPTARERSRAAPANAGTSLIKSGGTSFSDIAARLLRGGIDGSTLGTPPPHA